MTVPRVRIFISYSHTEKDSQIASRLVNDLKYKGFEVASDKSSQNRQKIAQSDWVVLVRTPSALQDKQVNNVVDTTLDIVSQRPGQKARLQNIVAFGVGPIDDPEKWPTIRTYNAGLNSAQPENYHQAFDKMVKTLSYVRTLAPEQQPALSGSGYQPSTISTLPRHSSINPNSSNSARKKFISSKKIILTVAALLVVGFSAWIYPKIQPSHKQDSKKATATKRVKATTVVTATATVNATATNTPMDQYYYKVTNQPADSTTFSSNSVSRWDSTKSCVPYSDGTYQVINTPPDQYTPCMRKSTNLDNFAYQVTMVIDSGYAGGIIWRSNPQTTIFYLFSLSRDGDYSLYTCSNNAGCPDKINTSDIQLTSGNIPLTPSSLPTATITVIATGNTFYLYVNGQFIFPIVQDPKSVSSSGEVGVYGVYAASTSTGQNPGETKITFSDLKVWSKLPQ